MNFVAQIAMTAAETEHHGNVALETLPFGILAAVVFLALGLTVFSFRNVANRHASKAEAWAERHGKDAHGSGHGH